MKLYISTNINILILNFYILYMNNYQIILAYKLDFQLVLFFFVHSFSFLFIYFMVMSDNINQIIFLYCIYYLRIMEIQHNIFLKLYTFFLSFIICFSVGFILLLYSGIICVSTFIWHYWYFRYFFLKYILCTISYVIFLYSIFCNFIFCLYV